MKTAGKPAVLNLTANREIIKDDGQDLSFITVIIRDEDGTLAPGADKLVHLDLNGGGKNSRSGQW